MEKNATNMIRGKQHYSVTQSTNLLGFEVICHSRPATYAGGLVISPTQALPEGAAQLSPLSDILQVPSAGSFESA